MRYGAWGVWLILGDSWWTCTLEVIFSWLARPCMDACMTFFLGESETYGAWWLLHVTNSGHMEGGCLLGGCLALEEHQPCWRRHWALDTIGLLGSLHGDLHLTLGQLSWWSGHVGVKKAHELGNELKLQTLEEKHWTIGSSAHPLETYSLIFITLELDMCHLGVESLTCVEHVWNMCGTTCVL